MAVYYMDYSALPRYTVGFLVHAYMLALVFDHAEIVRVVNSLVCIIFQ
ncbi:MAG: hypothetical protein P4M11_14120 [Candidatus Pacebacteria bacterium]|nr:hypothetical protein [Candidatus Paceibacterota bacterium]